MVARRGRAGLGLDIEDRRQPEFRVGALDLELLPGLAHQPCPHTASCCTCRRSACARSTAAPTPDFTAMGAVIFDVVTAGSRTRRSGAARPDDRGLDRPHVDGGARREKGRRPPVCPGRQAYGKHVASLLAPPHVRASAWAAPTGSQLRASCRSAESPPQRVAGDPEYAALLYVVSGCLQSRQRAAFIRMRPQVQNLHRPSCTPLHRIARCRSSP
jgi:hypothetical protein